MMSVSRRTFLTWMGLGTAAAGFGVWPTSLSAIRDGEIRQGRALRVVDVLSRPSASAKVVRQGWPDSVLEIRRALNSYFEVSDGYVPQTDIQPMVRASEQIPFSGTLPFWAEVTGPVSAVRVFAAADAPLVTRVGHGGVMQVVAVLPDEPRWIGLADSNGTLIGWSQASAWNPIRDLDYLDGGTLYLNRTALRWRLEHRGEVLSGGLFASGRDLLPGRYIPQKQSPGGQVDAICSGSSWRIEFGAGFDLAGTYWHNQFGRPMTGPAVQLPPFQARLCYECLAQDGMIIIE